MTSSRLAAPVISISTRSTPRATPARGQTCFEGREERFIHRHIGLAELPAPDLIGFKAVPLGSCAAQLLKTVGQLHPGHHKLEARGRLSAGAQRRQGGEGRGEVRDEGRCLKGFDASP